MHNNMTEEHKAAFRRLEALKPTNIHLLTNVSYGQRIDFESLWSRHGATAARYYLFPALWKGELHIKDGQDDQGRGDAPDCTDAV